MKAINLSKDSILVYFLKTYYLMGKDYWDKQDFVLPKDTCTLMGMCFGGLWKLFLVFLAGLFVSISLMDFVLWVISWGVNGYVDPNIGAIFTMSIFTLFIIGIICFFIHEYKNDIVRKVGSSIPKMDEKYTAPVSNTLSNVGASIASGYRVLKAWAEKACVKIDWIEKDKNEITGDTST